ncbi:PTS sugar transporter subunit IIA [Candidatus Spongiihabitans sp.]|uniref:PTS sugar transporter subunit IIA n=1 Tax=Candidatus Spongiihabitans sp. TaxID=3101308 RepID=UPI003C7A02DD
MTDAVSAAAHRNSEPQTPSPPMDSHRYLQPDLVVVNLCIASRKRLLKQFAELIAANAAICNSEHSDDPYLEQIFVTLHNRERLGSTALGNGIALPHGRIEGLSEPVIAIAKLEHPVDYDAPDGMPVWLAVCLLVPAEANEVHLSLLATLAAKFDDDDFVREVKKTGSTTEIYNLFSDI